MVKPKETEQVRGTDGFWAKKWSFLLVLVFGLILSIGIWGRMDQVVTGDDYAFHVARLQSASHAWSNGQVIPQVDPDALGGFGYAYNLFYGPLVTYIASVLQSLIQNWAITINLVLILALVLSGLTMCHAMTKISKSCAIGALAGIFYMATPYVLTDLYFRVALGESLAFIAAPILLLGLYQLTAGQRNATRSLAVAAALLILSHSLSALLFAMMAAVYVVLNIDKIFNTKAIWRAVLAVIVALGLTAVFTLPLIEAKIRGAEYGIFDASYVEGYFGADADNMNAHRLWPARMLFDMNFQYTEGAVVGLVAVFGLIGFFMVWRRLQAKQDRRFILSLFILASIALVLMTPAIDWNYVPEFFYEFQFPWRLLEIVALLTSALAAYACGMLIKDLSDERQRIATLVVGILAIMPVAWIFLPNDWNNVEHGDLSWNDTSSGNVGWQAEYAPKQMLCSVENPNEKDQDYKCSLEKIDRIIEECGTDLRVLDGKAKFSNLDKDGLNIEFDVRNDTEDVAEVELPLIYYPGYEAWLDSSELELGASEELGLVTVVVPGGANGKIKVFYGVSVPTQVGMMITMITVGVGLIWLVITGVGDARVRKKETEITKLMDTVRDAMGAGDEKATDLDLITTTKTNAKKIQATTTKKVATAKKSTKEKTKSKTSAATAAKKKMVAEKTQKAAEKTPKGAKTTKTSKTVAKTSASSAKSLTGETKGSKITRVKATPRVRKDPE